MDEGNLGLKDEQDPSAPKTYTKRQELNNHIVCMRNGVQQARIQTINRINHQIKKYKTRKGDTKGLEKAKRKADRLLEELYVLKKIKKDKVSLHALLNVEPLEDALNKANSTAETRVLARLSHHKVVTAEVKKYRDANPNWDKQIPVLLRMTKGKRKNSDLLESLKAVSGNSTNSDLSENDDTFKTSVSQIPGATLKSKSLRKKLNLSPKADAPCESRKVRNRSNPFPEELLVSESRDIKKRSDPFPEVLPKTRKVAKKNTNLFPDAFHEETRKSKKSTSLFSNKPQSESSANSEKLHPSWEAKKRQQHLTSFQGKKIIFDDDDDD